MISSSSLCPWYEEGLPHSSTQTVTAMRLEGMPHSLSSALLDHKKKAILDTCIFCFKSSIHHKVESTGSTCSGISLKSDQSKNISPEFTNESPEDQRWKLIYLFAQFVLILVNNCWWFHLLVYILGVGKVCPLLNSDFFQLWDSRENFFFFCIHSGLKSPNKSLCNRI